MGGAAFPTFDGKERFGITGRGGGSDPRIYEVLRKASKTLPEGWRAEAFSGFRPGARQSEHGRRNAVDVQLYDAQGKKIYN
jgi:hypothetical protein